MAVRQHGDFTLNSRIPTVQQELGPRLALAVEHIALIIQRGCQIRSRVDTGQMRSGWRVHQTALYEWTISNAVVHAIFNELGTRYMSAQPMLVPSVEAAEPLFRKVLSDALGGRW